MTHIKQTNNYFQILEARAYFRLKEKRPVLIDNVIKNLLIADKFGIDLQPPSLLIAESFLDNSKEYYADFLLFYQTFYGCCSFAKEYWQYLDIIVNNNNNTTDYCEQTFHQRYTKDIVSLLNEKTFDQLCQLKINVDRLLLSDSCPDFDFWDKAREILQAQKGRIHLICMHRDLLRRYIEKQQTYRSYTEKFNDQLLAVSNLGDNDHSKYIDNVINDIGSKNLLDLQKIRFLRSQVAYKTAKWLYTAKSNLSSQFLKFGNIATVYTHPTFEIMENTEVNRVGGFDKHIKKNTTEKNLNNKEKLLQSKNVLDNLQSQIFWLHRQIYLRRPKFFNRVHTGYEWNKFNQTHYDSDNTPPKVVLGYKFNIFYQDIISDSKTPSYSVEKDNESRDCSTCIIRFSATLPYKDIAFRIVNKQWEMARKKGFACIYENKILHLHFNFLRLRYRR